MPPFIPQINNLLPEPREIGALENFGNAFSQSLFTAPRVAFNELTGDVRESELVQRRADRSNPVRPGTSQFLGSVAGGLVPSAAAIGITAATGGATAPLTAAALLQGGTAAGQSIKDIREHEKRTGEDISTADTVATAALNGAIVGVFSRFGLGRVSQGVGAVSKEISKLSVQKATGAITQQQFRAAIAGKLAKVIPGSSAIEAVEEAAEQVGQNAIDQVFGTRTRALLEGVPQAALGGAIGGAVLGPVGVGAGLSSSIAQGKSEVQAQKDAERQKAEDIKELDALADQKVKNETQRMIEQAKLVTGVGGRPVVGGDPSQINLGPDVALVEVNPPDLVSGVGGTPVVGSESQVDISGGIVNPEVEVDPNTLVPVGRRPVVGGDPTTLNLGPDVSRETSQQPDIVTAVPPSSEANVPAQEDVLSTTAQAPDTPVEGVTGVEQGPEGPVSPQIAQEASEAAIDPEAAGTLFEGPDGVTLQATVIPGLDLAVQAIETGAKFTVQHARSAGQWLAQQGIQAYSSFKNASINLVKQFGESIKRHVGRILGEAKKFAKTAARNQQGAIGDVGKIRQERKRAIAKQTREGQKERKQEIALTPAELQGAKADDTRAVSKLQSEGKPPIIGDPANRGAVKDLFASIKGISKVAPFDFLKGRHAAERVSDSPDVQNAMYNNIKAAEAPRDQLNRNSMEAYDNRLRPAGIEIGTQAEAEMSVFAAAQKSIIEHIAAKVPFVKNKAGATTAKFRNIQLDNGQEVALVGNEIAEILASTVNPKQRESFLRSGFVIRRFRDDPVAKAEGYRTLNLSPEGLNNLIANATPQEKAAAQAAIDHYDQTVKPFMIEKALEEKDFELIAEIEEGGIYYPTQRDFNLATDSNEKAKVAERQRLQTDPATGVIAIDAQMGRAGFLQEKNYQTTAPMSIGDINVKVRNQTRRASTWATIDTPLRHAQLMLENRKAHMIRNYGQESVDYFNNFYSSVAEEVIGSQDKPLLGMEKFMRGLTRRLTKGLLGWNPTTVAKQTASITAAATELGTKNMAASTRLGFTSEFDEEMTTHSAALNERRSGDQSRLHNAPESVEQAEAQTAFGEVIMKPIKEADWAVMRMIWAATKLEYQQQNPGQAIDLAVIAARADQVVSETQPSFSNMDITGLQRKARKSPILKAMTMFTNQRFQNLNIIYGIQRDYRSGKITPQEAAKKLTLMVGVTPLMLFASEEAVRQIVGSGAEDREEFTRRIKQSIINTNIGNVPVVSPFAQFLSDKISNTFADSRFSRNPLEGFAEDTLTGVAKLVNESSTDNLDGFGEIIKNLSRAMGAPTKPTDLVSQLLENRF